MYIPVKYSSKDFNYLLELHCLKHRGTKVHALRARSVFKTFMTSLEKESNKISSITGSNSIVKRSICDASGECRELSIQLYGMNQVELDKILASNLHKLSHDEMLKESTKLCNFSSYILQIQYGDFTAVFLGDAPVKRSIDVLSGLNVNYFKVAHHGSRSGTTQDLLSKLDYQNTKSIAAVTPYYPSNLPKEETINHLQSFNFEILRSDDFSDEVSNRKQQLLSLDSNPLFDIEIKKVLAFQGSIVKTVFHIN